EAYRRLRNTIRFLLANLAGFDEKERIGVADMPELERFMLAKLVELDVQVREGYAGFDFNRVAATLFNFCTNELSAFYFDIRKDVLYCDAATANRRRATRTVMDEIFRRVVTWFAPILCFTMEEAWLSRFPGAESVHLETFFDVPSAWKNPALIEKWKRVRELRRVVTGALELERAGKRIGSSLEAAPSIYVVEKSDGQLLRSVPFDEVTITSGVTIVGGEAPPGAFSLPDVKGVAVIANLSPGKKCERCWRVLSEVGSHADHPRLCNRCHGAVTA
ncbi:MAG TPA: class I tRNA ligase family protein, partial [Rhizomicrobium sp.]